MKLHDKIPCFLMVDHSKGRHLLNLSQVTVVEKISDDEVRMTFTPDHTFNIHGKPAMQLLALCSAYSIFADGTPLADLNDKSEAEGPTSNK